MSMCVTGLRARLSSAMGMDTNTGDALMEQAIAASLGKHHSTAVADAEISSVDDVVRDCMHTSSDQSK